MIARRHLLAGASAGLLAGAAPLAPAQKRPFRIVMLLFRGWEEACDGFRDYFSTRGIAVELIIRDAREQLAPIADYVREINAMRPDLVYIWGTGTAIAALGPWDAADPARHITDIPVVFNIVTDPVGNRIVKSMTDPGRDVTGTVYITPLDVQLHTIEAYRSFRTIAALYNSAEQNSLAIVAGLRQRMAASGRTFIDSPLPTTGAGHPDATAIPGLVAAAKQAKADWLYIPPDTFLNEERERLTGAALDAGLPTFAATERFVTFSHGLAGLVCRYYNIGAFTAFKAEQILLGGKRAREIPVETLSRFSLLIRIETAKHLEFFPPLSMLRYSETV